MVVQKDEGMIDNAVSVVLVCRQVWLVSHTVLERHVKVGGKVYPIGMMRSSSSLLWRLG